MRVSLSCIVLALAAPWAAAGEGPFGPQAPDHALQQAVVPGPAPAAASEPVVLERWHPGRHSRQAATLIGLDPLHSASMPVHAAGPPPSFAAGPPPFALQAVPVPDNLVGTRHHTGRHRR